MAEHRAGNGNGVDDIVSALDAQLQFMGSHRRGTIERSGAALERCTRAVRRCRAARHPASAAPRACARTNLANTTIRLSALYSGWQADSTSRS